LSKRHYPAEAFGKSSLKPVLKSCLLSPIVAAWAEVLAWIGSPYVRRGNRAVRLPDRVPYLGRATVEAPAPIEIIPVFARGAVIVPTAQAIQHVDEDRDAPYEIRVYCGADGFFPLHEDEGDSYNHELGRFSIVPLGWDDATGELVIGERAAAFEGLVASREFGIVFISATGRSSHDVINSEAKIRLRTDGADGGGASV